MGTDTWTCANNYILDGYVFIQSGQALTIEAGTVVKGAAGTGADASAMIVAKGGQLFAEGTADCPIIFTYEGDPLDGSVSYDTRGQWGGLIVLGDATTNFGGAAQVEGIPSDNDLATYGGENDEDNSGVITYVSIRHGGTQLGAANEINGLTLAGVGSGTTIHHVEVVSNLDDGIEFFGGSVTVDNALVAFCGDDSFDWDQGYHGTGTNWLAIQDQPGDEGDRGGELDGDDSDDGNVAAMKCLLQHLPSQAGLLWVSEATKVCCCAMAQVDTSPMPCCATQAKGLRLRTRLTKWKTLTNVGKPAT